MGTAVKAERWLWFVRCRMRWLAEVGGEADDGGFGRVAFTFVGEIAECRGAEFVVGTSLEGVGRLLENFTRNVASDALVELAHE